MGNRKSIDILPEIQKGETPTVLFVGNGMNLSFEGAPKTDDIVSEEWEKNYGREPGEEDALWKLPFPMQVVAATKDHVQGSMTALAQKLREFEVSQKQKTFIGNILKTGFDAVLTTNYSLEFEKSTMETYSPQKVYGKYRVTNEQTPLQEQFGVFRCTELEDSYHTLLWHVHGTALRKDSIVMGQLYYGVLLSEVTKRAKDVNRLYKSSLALNTSFRPKSWVDYFLIGDVHMMGFKLDLSETDIWWLLSYKKSAFPDSKVYYYEPSIPEEKEILLDCYEVKKPVIGFSGNYLDYYESICLSIKERG